MLPICSHEDQIVTTILEHPVTIIVAETGAGKSQRHDGNGERDPYRQLVREPRRRDSGHQ